MEEAEGWAYDFTCGRSLHYHRTKRAMKQICRPHFVWFCLEYFWIRADQLSLLRHIYIIFLLALFIRNFIEYYGVNNVVEMKKKFPGDCKILRLYTLT